MTDQQKPSGEESVFESCHACGGTGLMLGGAGEPTECSTCKGNGVIKSQAKATNGKTGMAVGMPHVRQNNRQMGLRVGAAVAVQPATSELMDVTAGETAPLLAHIEELEKALRNVQKLISEAAMTGFNCHDGDWAERLFASQQVTSRVLKSAVTAHQRISPDREGGK